MLLSLAEKIVDSWYAMVPRPKPDAKTLKNTRIIAHRGAHDKAAGIIENTDEAFKRAQSLGCWGIELDIHATADEKLVVNHDPDLRRLWNHKATIKELHFNELRQLQPAVPALSEVVERYGKSMHLFIELKAPFTAEKQLLEELKSLTPCEDYHLLSLDESLFTSLQAIPREAMILVAVNNNSRKFCRLSLEKGYGGVCGHYLLLSDSLIQPLRSARQIFGVGFIDSRFSLYREVSRNIPWLFTNNAEKICPIVVDRL